MKKSIWIIIVLLLAGIFGLAFMFNDEELDNGTPNGNGGGGEIVATDMIRVDSPRVNQVVASPLTITGEARGNWYFEASFPVRIIDANGQVLGEHYAEAQSEWMTTNFVPFVSTLTFTTPTTNTGTLIIEKDNPSGLPENAAEIRIPVRFDLSSTTGNETRAVYLYFYNESKDKDSSGNIMCSAQGLERVEREIPRTITPIQDTIRLLLRGELTPAERSRGVTTEFPLPGLALEAASLSGGVLTLTFTDPQNETGGGSCRVNILRAQIEATAKQFSGVSQVQLMPEELFQP